MNKDILKARATIDQTSTFIGEHFKELKTSLDKMYNGEPLSKSDKSVILAAGYSYLTELMIGKLEE